MCFERIYESSSVLCFVPTFASTLMHVYINSARGSGSAVYILASVNNQQSAVAAAMAAVTNGTCTHTNSTCKFGNRVPPPPPPLPPTLPRIPAYEDVPFGGLTSHETAAENRRIALRGPVEKFGWMNEPTNPSRRES